MWRLPAVRDNSSAMFVGIWGEVVGSLDSAQYHLSGLCGCEMFKSVVLTLTAAAVLELNAEDVPCVSRSIIASPS